MQFTSKTDYALRAMLDLADQSDGRADGKWTFTRDIAARQDIPLKFLAQIVRDLRRAGLVEASRGPQGGVKLGLEAAKISVMEIIEAIEGPMALFPCLAREGACGSQESCPVRETFAEAQDKLSRVLDAANLGDLSRQYKCSN